MAGIASKVVKIAAGAAAAAGFYYAGMQAGRKEALEEAVSCAEGTATSGGAEGTTAPAKTARPNPLDTPEAYHEALNDRSATLRDRIAEKAFAEGSIEERFDRIVSKTYGTLEQSDFAVASSQGDAENPALEEPSDSKTAPVAAPETTPEVASDAAPETAPETAPEAEEAQPEAIPGSEDAPSDADEQAPAGSEGEIDLKNAKTGDLDPYHRIQKALLYTSEFFDEEDGEGHKPPEFNMP